MTARNVKKTSSFIKHLIGFRKICNIALTTWASKDSEDFGAFPTLRRLTQPLLYWRLNKIQSPFDYAVQYFCLLQEKMFRGITWHQRPLLKEIEFLSSEWKVLGSRSRFSGIELGNLFIFSNSQFRIKEHLELFLSASCDYASPFKGKVPWSSTSFCQFLFTTVSLL
jgi:hypothetical protein